MKVLIILSMLLSTSVFARTTGDIRLGDGSTTVRISVGNSNSNNKEMVKRIRRLEMAVSHLQMRVYELEDGNAGQQNFKCSVKLCRKSSSSLATSARNCEFYELFKKEVVSVWATNGGEAEAVARRKLGSDRDILVLKDSTLSCR